ncbi:MAG: AI-2E family transporter [Eubacteriales bacterium]
MKFKGEKKHLNWGITAFLVIASSISFYYLIFRMDSVVNIINKTLTILTPILNGLLIAYVVTPLLNYIEYKLIIPLMERNSKTGVINKKTSRSISLLITMFIVFTLLYSFFALIIPQIYYSILNIVSQYNTYVSNLLEYITKLVNANPDLEVIIQGIFTQYSNLFNEWMNDIILPQVESIIKSLSSGVIGFVGALFNIILGFIISIYLLSGKDTFASQSKKVVYAFMETASANQFIRDVRFAHRTFSGFIMGKIIDSIIMGFLCFIGLVILKIPYALLISLIIGVTNIIPYFGPFLGAIPSGLLILMINPKLCLYFAIFIIILQQFDGNILGPKILGEYTGISSFWVIFAITVGGGLLGIFGMFIGVPVFAVLYAGLKAGLARRLNKKGLTSHTEKYMFLDRIDSEERFIYTKGRLNENGTITKHLSKPFKEKKK